MIHRAPPTINPVTRLIRVFSARYLLIAFKIVVTLLVVRSGCLKAKRILLGTIRASPSINTIISRTSTKVAIKLPTPLNIFIVRLMAREGSSWVCNISQFSETLNDSARAASHSNCSALRSRYSGIFCIKSLADCTTRPVNSKTMMVITATTGNKARKLGSPLW